jgi:hypothetical protein
MPEFPYHNQGNPHACGAACLMMMLESRGVPLESMRQSRLMSELDAAAIVANDSYDSSPEAVVAVANQKLASHANPRLPAIHYEIWPEWIAPRNPASRSAASDDECIAAIQAGLRTGAPVFLLANGGQHWILVYRFRSQYFVRWPVPGPLPAWNGIHNQPECSVCADGYDERHDREALLGFLNGVLRRYSLPPGYKGQRILLVPRRTRTSRLSRDSRPDPAPPEMDDRSGLARDRMMAEPASEDLTMAGAAGADEPRPPVLPPTEESARTYVQSQLSRFEKAFDRDGFLLANATAGPAVRVSYLPVDAGEAHSGPGDYFLVPVFASGANEPHFLARMGATDGALSLSASRSKDPGKTPWVFADPKSPRQIPPGWISNQRLVWQPCQQSLTPLQPFLEVRRASDGATGYLDLNGEVHLELTRANAGKFKPAPPPSSLKWFYWLLAIAGGVLIAYCNRPGGAANGRKPLPNGTTQDVEKGGRQPKPGPIDIPSPLDFSPVKEPEAKSESIK